MNNKKEWLPWLELGSDQFNDQDYSRFKTPKEVYDTPDYIKFKYRMSSSNYSVKHLSQNPKRIKNSKIIYTKINYAKSLI